MNIMMDEKLLQAFREKMGLDKMLAEKENENTLDLSDSVVIDASNEDWIEVLKENGVKISQGMTPEEIEENQSETEKLRSVINKKYADITEIWKYLNNIYDFEPNLDKTFSGRMGLGIATLSTKPNYELNWYGMDSEERKDAFVKEREERFEAFNYVINYVSPSPNIGWKVTIKHADEEFWKALEKEFKEAGKPFDRNNVKSRELATRGYTTGDSFSFMTGTNNFLDECHKAHLISHAFEVVMGEARDKNDVMLAQQMMAAYISVHSKDKNQVLAYTPLNIGKVPAYRKCQASKNVFNPNRIVAIRFDKSWITKRNGSNGEFYIMKLPTEFNIGKQELGKYGSTFDADKLQYVDGYYVYECRYNENLRLKVSSKDSSGDWVSTSTEVKAELLADALDLYYENNKNKSNNSGRTL